MTDISTMLAPAGPREVPALEPNRELVLPTSAGADASTNGLTVIAIERRTVPLVEVRLRLPFERSIARPAVRGRPPRC